MLPTYILHQAAFLFSLATDPLGIAESNVSFSALENGIRVILYNITARPPFIARYRGVV
jgi:hypothetical protein